MPPRKKPTRCSKNYINCRKHPARTGVPVKDRIKQDFRALNATGKEEFNNSKGDLVPVDEDSDYKNKKRVKQLRDLETVVIISKSDLLFRETSLWDDGVEITSREKADLVVKRSNLFKELEMNAEKEDYYASEKSLNAFQEAMSSLLVDEGTFIDENSRSWGDDRGSHIYPSQHFNDCGVAGINEYDEFASWHTYDSFSSEDTVGVRAELSCNCGEYFKQPVYSEPATMGNMISRLMTR